MSWTFTDANPPELTCSFQPKCHFCGTKMTLKKATMYKVQMSGQNNPEPQGRAIDIMMLCPECQWVGCFGVALSQEEARKIYG